MSSSPPSVNYNFFLRSRLAQRGCVFMSLSPLLNVEVTILTGVYRFDINIATFLANFKYEFARNEAISISN